MLKYAPCEDFFILNLQGGKICMSILEVSHLAKTYQSRFSSQQTAALRDVSFQIEKGEFVAVMGESGSGKTTLLNLLALFDTPTAGTISIDGTLSTQISHKELAAFRRNRLGFVFQDFSLLDMFSIKDNILLPLVLNGENRHLMEEKLKSLSKAFGLDELLEKYPYEVSGGQKQRAACARALITNPDLLFADEPTGALDSKNADSLLDLFEEINAHDQTIVMVTHSVKAASYANRVLFIQDGRIFHELYRQGRTKSVFYQEISDTLSLLQAKKDDHRA
jgi:putative ABC transport system ATP-binding protein